MKFLTACAFFVRISILENLSACSKDNNDSGKNMKGFFITFEGGEGCGKSTQSRLLYELLKQKGCGVIHTREPGGTKVSEAVRRIILDPGNLISPMAELFLYETARTQHITDVILPAIGSGMIVICDRFTDATIAYQGYGRGLDISIIKELNKIASCGLKPGLTVYLDITPEKGLLKARKIRKDFKKACDRLESESMAFHKRVRKGYLALAKQEPSRIKVVRTRNTIEQTQREVAQVVMEHLPARCKF
jgi:dTMP kinase